MSERARDEQILVLAPTGRDSIVTIEVLEHAGFAASPCADIAEMCSQLAEGAGALVIAEEAFTRSALDRLSAALREQPPWSGIAILMSAARGE